MTHGEQARTSELTRPGSLARGEGGELREICPHGGEDVYHHAGEGQGGIGHRRIERNIAHRNGQKIRDRTHIIIVFILIS